MSLFLLFKFTYKLSVRQMNRTYYFYNDQINISNFDARLLKLDKKTSMVNGSWYLLHWLCHKKTEWNVNSVNPFYLMINGIDGFTEEKNEDKYLNIASTDRNSEVLLGIGNWENMAKIT